MSFNRYRTTLSDPGKRAMVFGTPPAQLHLTLTHDIEGDIQLLTSQMEVLADENHNLFKAWQILHGVSATVAVLEYYLRTYARQVGSQEIKGVGVWDRIECLKVSTFPKFDRLREFLELRNIGAHNLTKVNQRFRDRTQKHHLADGPYVFTPYMIKEVRDIGLAFVDWAENEARTA